MATNETTNEQLLFTSDHKPLPFSETNTSKVLERDVSVHDDSPDGFCTVKLSIPNPEEEAAFKMQNSNRKDTVLSFKEIKLIKVKLGHQDNRNSYKESAKKKFYPGFLQVPLQLGQAS